MIAGKGHEQGQEFARRQDPVRRPRGRARRAAAAWGRRRDPARDSTSCAAPLGVLEWRGRTRSPASRSTRAGSSPGDLFVAARPAASTSSSDALARGAAATLVPERRRSRRWPRSARAVRDRSERPGRRRSPARPGRPRRRTSSPRSARRPRAPSPPRRATTTRSACRSRSAGSSPTPRSASSSWPCAGFGQIAELCEIARPEIGVITNVGPAHLELVGSLEGVARAKGELVAALPPGGTAIVPGRSFPVERDDLERRSRRRSPTLARATAARCRSAAARSASTSRRATRRANALAALAALDALGLPRPERVDVDLLALARRGVAAPGRRAADQRRLQRQPRLDARRARAPRRARGRPATVAILGEMAELGPDAPRFHDEVGAAAREPASTCSSPSASSPRLPRGRRAGAGRRAGPRTRATAAASTSVVRARRLRPRQGSRALGLEVVAEALAAVPRSDPRPDRGHRRAARLDPARPALHRVPAPQRVRPAHPRGGPRAATSSSRARRRWAAS